MISDRFYMRDNYERKTTSALTWIICAIVAGFIFENIALRWFANPEVGRTFMRAFMLSPETIRSGFIWTLATYSLLHDPGQFFHILGNLVGIYFLGRELVPHLGQRRFVAVCLGTIFTGGLVWLGCHWMTGGNLIGASAAVCGLLVVFACINPEQPITLLLFWILPVTLKPKYLALGLLAFDLFGLLFLELPERQGSLAVAHSAHLGGMLAGWIYFRYIHAGDWLRQAASNGKIELPGWFRKARKSATPAPAFKLNLTNRETLRTEVDRILDKINSNGFGSLTPEEKTLLDNAKDMLSRR